MKALQHAIVRIVTDKTKNLKHLNVFISPDLSLIIFIYGDVYFTEKAMDVILQERDETTFFGRNVIPSSVFGDVVAREIFATVLMPNDMGVVRDFKDAFMKGRIQDSGAWNLYYYLASPEFINIDDFTQDFDTPHIYKHFMKAYDNLR